MDDYTTQQWPYEEQVQQNWKKDSLEEMQPQNKTSGCFSQILRSHEQSWGLKQGQEHMG